MRIRNPKNRQGLTLLFVVSMIVLFLLMGTTFVIISNDYYRAARKRSIAKLNTIDRTALVHRAFYDIVRGPSLLDVNSPFRAQDLLSDQYGYGFRAYINGDEDTATSALEAPTSVGNKHFIRVTLRSDIGTSGMMNEGWSLQRPDVTTPISLGEVGGLYNGLVFTVVSGPAKGISTRIVDHSVDATSGHHYFWLIPTWLDRVVNPPVLVDPSALVDAEVIVNGLEFSGTGAGGYNTDPNSIRKLTAEALHPNRIGEAFSDLERYYFSNTDPPIVPPPPKTISTFPNESYDAADFQNMFLSGRDNEGNIIPSFHRKSLYDYMYDPNDTAYDIRRYSFRPIFRDIIDNATDTPLPGGDGIPDPGSTANADFVLAYNRYISDSASTSAPNDLEIDNDGDGVKDSVFIDPGYSIITDNTGRRFKPLVAYHIVDLDGRLNLNAHGNLTQVRADSFISVNTPLLGNPPTATLPRGSGYGPPDVNLAGLFLNNNSEYAQLLASRYGVDGVPGDVNRRDSLRKLYGYPVEQVDWSNGFFGTVSRRAGTGVPGSLFASSAMDIQTRFAMGFPANAVVNTSNTYDDFRDRNYVGFPNGLPVINMLASTVTANEFDNNPYEMSFAPLPYGNPSDQPYSPAELERVLRQFDVDSKVLPYRLWKVANATWTEDTDYRHLVTTDSFEVPVLHENFKAKLMSRLPDLASDLGSSSTEAQLNARADQLIGVDPDGNGNYINLFAPELLRGLKMDVNRPLGNGYDDDGDGVVDEPDEAASEYDRDYTGQAFDLNRDGVRDASDSNARQLFARNLYMLVLLLTDNIEVDLDGDGTATEAEYREIIAQWAVNVVDFRDPDSIMTRFQFDVNPWDGTWNDASNGTPMNDANTVWGCERPELLITETLGVHVRRTEDLSSDPSGEDVENDGEEDWDQGLRPEPFAFIELYNPWTQNSLNQKLDPSLYNTSTQGVQLDRVSIAANGDRCPVWRLSIDRPDRGGAATDARPMRYVYFTDPDVDSDAIDDDDGGNIEVFFSTWNASTLKPGTQALVGSLGIEDPNNAGQYRSFMGRRAGKTQGDEAANNLELDTTQQIRIEPATGEVTRYPADTTNDPRYSVILPIDTARLGTKNSPTANRNFSVSDAFGGYTDLDAIGAPSVQITDGDGYRYSVPHDVPLDHQSRTDNNRNTEDMSAILADEGMAQNFRTIKLQRLANPQMPWHETDNPYRTIDVMEMDLVAFNGVVPKPRTSNAPEVETAAVPDKAVALERGVEGIGPANARSQPRDLWRSARGPIGVGTPLPNQPADAHNFNFLLTETFGKTNDAFINASGPNNGFSWLTWNNRPFISHLELANVPFAEPQWLTRNFTTKDDTDPYIGFDNTVRGRFRHLLNFFAYDDDPDTPTRANLHRVMDYLEVPSRFVGTDQQLNPINYPSPFDYISRYRVPGKINLNTIYNSTIWEGLQGNFSTLGCDFQTFIESREDRIGIGPMPTDFGNPFRPAGEGIYVPPGAPTVTGPGTTLFRNDEPTTGATGEPLFDFDNTNVAYNSDRNAYFRNAQRQRLGNLVTNKSSVFAIWITVAYFEVDENGLVGAELGSDTGEITRNRGFYIYDRSIPVGFEPGKNHNVERGILVQSIIE